MLLKYRQNSLTLTQCVHVCVSETHTIKITYSFHRDDDFRDISDDSTDNN